MMPKLDSVLLYLRDGHTDGLAYALEWIAEMATDEELRSVAVTALANRLLLPGETDPLPGTTIRALYDNSPFEGETK